MVALRYFPATETENNGITEHEDGNCITFVFQDSAGGLEVRKNGKWIPVIPTEGTIAVNVSDVLQVITCRLCSFSSVIGYLFFPSEFHHLYHFKGKEGENMILVLALTITCFVLCCLHIVEVLSNNKFKSATHRVVRPKVKSRYSYAFFYNLQGEKWVEPLPQFTKDIGKAPNYRGFLYKEYQELRMRNKTHPTSRPEEVIHITHYATTSQPDRNNIV